MLLIPKILILKSIFPFLAFAIIWELVWKWIALYKAGQKGDILRFVCIFIFNTCGILPILYLLIDSIKKDDIDLSKENDKTTTEIKKTKKTLKGGVKTWENVMPEKKQKEMQKDSWKKKLNKLTKKTQK